MGYGHDYTAQVMAKNLIIVESPAKVKTIKKFLGRDFQVEASVGHVRDLPSNKIGVDESKDFRPDYRVIPGKQKVVAKLKAAADQAEHIYLAPDPDREGEAIAWHVAHLIGAEEAGGKSAKGDKAKQVSRIQFNEITSRAVKEALANPRQLDENLFNSQQARRILDRLVGYKLSPLLWSKVKRGISAGRVQSVALRLIVDRERERQAFRPEEYWVFKALLEGPEPPAFAADLWKIEGKKAQVGSGEQAQVLYDRVKDQPFVVSAVEEKERQRHPSPPFITSTLQQDASRRLGFTAKRTMSTAQRLYEGVELGERGVTALITYMRTDSVRISDEARATAQAFITETMGPEYYPPKPRYFKTKSGAQDAHEAIRPVDARITPESVKKFLPADQYKLYTLVWQRFLASQMAAARLHDTIVTVDTIAPGAKLADGKPIAQWRARGERVLFPGFLKVYGVVEEPDEASADEPASGKAAMLPKLEPGMELTVKKLTKDQKFTQPPPRYTEASLVKELEDKGIGRPSTYAAIISTLLDRDYARLEEKKFAPTELGATVVDLLSKHFQSLMDVRFTAGMEERLDDVAGGKADWVELLKNFTGDFYPTLDKAKDEMAQVKGGLETGVVCDLCGKPMNIRFGKNGEFLGCTGYPDCKGIKNFTRDEQGRIQIVERPNETPEKVGTCPDCGKDLVLKRSRTGSRFIACSGYPDCRHAEPFSTGVACPRDGCKGALVEKSSKRGKVFYSCSTFPKCDYATWDWPIAKPCPVCDSKILTIKTTKARGEHVACPEKSCRFTRDLEPDETTG